MHQTCEWDAINFNVSPLHGLNKLKLSALFDHLSAVDSESFILYTVYCVWEAYGGHYATVDEFKMLFYLPQTWDVTFFTHTHTTLINLHFSFSSFATLRVFRFVTKESSTKMIYYVNRLIYANLCSFHYPSVSITSAKLSNELKS